MSISRHFTKILRHTGYHEADGVVRRDHVLTNMPNAEQTQSARCLTRTRAKSESVPIEQDDKFGKNGARKVASPRWGGLVA